MGRVQRMFLTNITTGYINDTKLLRNVKEKMNVINSPTSDIE